MKLATHETGDHCCIDCGSAMECASNLDPDQMPPCEGDWTVCFQCGAIMVFGKGLRPRAPSGEERTRVPDAVLNIVAGIAMLRAGKR